MSKYLSNFSISQVAIRNSFKSKSDARRAKTGFTLIELLVVIVIISILAALLMVNFIGVRQRGRDAQRKSDLRQLQSALELYRSDVGFYPSSTPFSTCGGNFANPNNNTIIYIKKVPCDPLVSTTPYLYQTTDSGLTYTLYACLENLGDPDRDTGSSGSPTPQSSCTTAGYASVTLSNP